MSNESATDDEDTLLDSWFDDDERERIRRFAATSRYDRRPDHLLPGAETEPRAEDEGAGGSGS